MCKKMSIFSIKKTTVKGNYKHGLDTSRSYKKRRKWYWTIFILIYVLKYFNMSKISNFSIKKTAVKEHYG